MNHENTMGCYGCKGEGLSGAGIRCSVCDGRGYVIIHPDYKDAVMLLRRTLKHLPEPLFSQINDWLKRRGVGSILRDE